MRFRTTEPCEANKLRVRLRLLIEMETLDPDEGNNRLDRDLVDEENEGPSCRVQLGIMLASAIYRLLGEYGDKVARRTIVEMLDSWHDMYDWKVDPLKGKEKAAWDKLMEVAQAASRVDVTMGDNGADDESQDN